MNFQVRLEEELGRIEESKKTPTLLLHACCAPCSSYVLEYLAKYFEITILYYNPNIYPSEEYERRKQELIDFLPQRKYPHPVHLVEDKYLPEEYEKAIFGLEDLGEKTRRCYECYMLRMRRACEYASQNHFDYFTTTLSISPYKVSSWINEIGKLLEKEYSVKYLYADFKKKGGYLRSLELSREYHLYRQDYCGCKFSMEERERKEV